MMQVKPVSRDKKVALVGTQFDFFMKIKKKILFLVDGWDPDLVQETI